MDHTVGSYEAKTHLSRLLERVAKGERITITRHGVPVAVLIPAPSVQRPDVEEGIQKLKALRARRKGPGLAPRELRELIEEGRR